MPSGMCALCGQYGNNLQFFNGQLLCQDCLDRLEEQYPGLIDRSNFPSRFPTGRTSFSPSFLSHESVDEDDRKAMYFGTARISFIAFAIFLILTSPLIAIFGFNNLVLNWHKVGFIELVVVFLLSRVVDMVSTVIMLQDPNCIETNPLSDRRDVSKLFSIHGQQIIIILIGCFIFRLITPYIGNFLLIILSLTGFRAAISNLTQPLGIIFMPTSVEDSQRLFYANAVICSIIIAIAAFFAGKYFI